ncbi:SDR family oxidoreductase [Qipengyuania sp. S6317L1]|uniref:SDR family NAD(P)-dependent oxidoreductase n=1 Tax=Qipengyuania sp. S6317L1 TaxID=2926410 RepID=UPI001FF1D3AF|nr:SDR family oxidoreductase [Qipengyuania sp. S6317L1]MCK0100059.1 SDR family oxidoreductase [Qipengyuania sp. S6317L1]
MLSDRLQGKVALVTGGTSGIGAGTVERLAREGAKVVFTGRNADAGKEVADRSGATFVQHTVDEPSDWPELMARIAKDHGRLDIAFANAGSEKGDSNVEDISIEGWNGVIGVNQTGVMLTVQNAIRAMKNNPDGPTGSIIVNSSMNAHRAMGNFLAYSVSKAAVVALAKSAAIHCGNQGYKIRVNAILPGVVETAMISNLIESSEDPAATRAAYAGMSPLKRMANVDEVAAFVAYLGSDEASFISGADLVIDGATTAGMMGL